MEVGSLYQFVLLLVLVGMILGVGILVLDKFAATDGITVQSAGVLKNTSASLAPIATTWLGLIVTIAVLAIILTLVIRSFAMRGR